MTAPLRIAMPRMIRILTLFTLILPCSLVGQSANATSDIRPVEVLNGKDIGEEIGKLYPPKLRDMEISGYVVLRLLVGADSKLEDTDILVSSGVHAFDRAAVRVAGKMVLRAAERAGTPIESRVRVPITFQGKPKKGSIHLKQARALNRDSVRVVAAQRVPSELREDSLNADVGVTLDIDNRGIVKKAMLNQSSCFVKTDAAALEIGRLLRFSPITDPNAERAQVNVTVSFQRDSVFLRVAGDTLLSDTVPQSPSAPVHRQRPELSNRPVLSKKLGEAYPPDPNVTGPLEALVWILVDVTGSVARRQMVDTTGNCWADLGILRALKAARFTPALLDEQPVRVWIQLPVILKPTAAEQRQ
jgi:TonB family protein